MNILRIMLGIVLLFFGIFLLLIKLSILAISNELMFGSFLIVSSLISFSILFNSGRRDLLIVCTALFMIGIVLLVKSNYEIFETRGLVFTSLLFICGASSVVLFIENPKAKLFLPTGLILIFFGYLSVTFLREIGIINFANVVARKFDRIWPIILILFGLIIFLNRKR